MSYVFALSLHHKSLCPHHPLRSLPVRQQYIILQNDYKNQPTRLHQPTVETANQRLFRTRQNASFGLPVNGTPWERVTTLTCKRYAVPLQPITIIHTTPAHCHIRFATSFDLCERRSHAEPEYQWCAIHYSSPALKGFFNQIALFLDVHRTAVVLDPFAILLAQQ